MYSGYIHEINWILILRQNYIYWKSILSSIRDVIIISKNEGSGKLESHDKKSEISKIPFLMYYDSKDM